jgi:hypothetical membrane protein
MAEPSSVPSERYGPLVHRSVHHGALLWLVASVQFIVAMIVTQAGWDLRAGNPTYSLAHNYISDLGAVNCGEYAGRFVCSPWHLVFDGSIVVLGVLLILGTLLLTSAFPARATRTVGLGLLVIAAIGSIGVGLSPEDVDLAVHSASALTAFLAGNVALIVLGLAMFRDTRWGGFRAFSVICGLVGFVALVLFAAGAWNWGGFFGGWGVGGIERTIVAPVLLWAIVVSIHLLRIRAFAPRMVPGTPT